MSNSWKAKCIWVDSDRTNWSIGEIVNFEDGKVFKDKIGWCIIRPKDYLFTDWCNEIYRSSKWELIEDNTLSVEEVIELLVEIISNNCLKFKIFSNYPIEILTSKIIIDKLIKYKNSKLIMSISKLDYNKIATDKLNSIYPNGWKVEE